MEPMDAKQLANIYKKNGTFDKQRRKLLDNFKSSMTYTNLLLRLKIMVENKVKQDPSILMKNKGKMAALIQGEILGNGNKNDNGRNNDNDSFLSIVDKDIQEKLIDSPEFHNLVKVELKDIKRKQQGISDDEFAKQLAEEEKLEKIKSAERERNSLRHRKISKPPKLIIKSTSERSFSSRSNGDARGGNRGSGSRGGDNGGRSGNLNNRSASASKDFHLMY